MPQYTIGIDFGSLSGRAVLVDTKNGHEIASAQLDYPHAVMDKQLPCGKILPPDWALQHPQDYLDVLDHVLPELMKDIDPADVIGIGVDCTASTVLPVLDDGTPLCFTDAFRDHPHAYVMMWKHHGAQAQANRMTQAARKYGDLLSHYGGIVNAEWYLPKLLEVLEEAPDVYQTMAHYVEAVDWLVWQLTGRLCRSYACLGYKAFYRDGHFPPKDFLRELNPAFENVTVEKMSGPIVMPGKCAGLLSEKAARRYGLKAGIPVAAGNIDAHVCVPAAGIDGPGKLLAIIGTSTCHIICGEKTVSVPGMSGVVQEGVLPGLAAYEAGQSCVGDSFGWFERTCVNTALKREAQDRGIPVQVLLTEKAACLKPGQSGLLALDWWNGNRSVLADTELTGLLLGMTLSTTPQEIYRALLESTAYGARIILDSYRENGIPVEMFFASGGVSQKNELAMQIYADVLLMSVHIADAAQGPAHGSAIYAAVSAGVYADAAEGARRMGAGIAKTYQPIAENVAVYEKLYQEYRLLHDYFGRGGNDVMKKLKMLRKGGIIHE